MSSYGTPRRSITSPIFNQACRKRQHEANEVLRCSQESLRAAGGRQFTTSAKRGHGFRLFVRWKSGGSRIVEIANLRHRLASVSAITAPLAPRGLFHAGGMLITIPTPPSPPQRTNCIRSSRAKVSRRSSVPRHHPRSLRRRVFCPTSKGHSAGVSRATPRACSRRQ